MNSGYDNLIHIMKNHYPRKGMTTAGCKPCEAKLKDLFGLKREVNGLKDAVGVANYRKAQPNDSGNCGNCAFFDKDTGYCRFFDFTAKADYVCDEWKPRQG